MKAFRNILLVLVILLTLTTLVAPTSAQSSMVDLGTLGGPTSRAFGINDLGQVVGWSYTDAMEYRPFLWENGVMTDLGTLGGAYSGANAINNSEQVVGWNETAEGKGHAVLWENGVMTDLGTLGGAYSFANDINDLGQVVGESDTTEGGVVHAFLWENGVMTDLGTLGGAWGNHSSWARGINDLGQVVGWGYTEAKGHAFLWENGVMTDLGTLGGPESGAFAINDLGQVVGASNTAAGESHAFLWENGVMTDLGTLGGAFSVANAINNSGQVVGQSITAAGESHAFLWENGVMTDLGTLGGDYSQASGINNLGQVVGTSNISPGSFAEFHAFLWTIPAAVNQPPAVGPITAPLDPVPVNTTISASAPFSDPDASDTHTAVWDWGDGNTTPGTISEAQGSGTVSGDHAYGTPGVYPLTLTVSDNHDAAAAMTFQYVVIYDPSGGFVTGGGWFDSPAGAYVPDPALESKATFGFVSKYQQGATVPIGNTQFQFKLADLNFHSSSYEWLVVNQSGTNAQFKGSGAINGAGSYQFMLWASDDTLDTFRIKIWEEVDGVESVIYDNGVQQPIGGAIIVHKN